jgi:integrase
MSNVVTLRRAPQRQSPVRRPNAELRTREHLTQAEVDRLIEAGKANRHGHRNATMILVAYRHGLRASELVDLDQVHFDSALLHVRRVKAGTPSTHPLTGLEMRAAAGELGKLAIFVRERARSSVLGGRIRPHV